MIKDSMLLILGAGSAMQFGFPLGPELKKNIVAALAPTDSGRVTSTRLNECFGKKNIDYKTVFACHDALRLCGTESVDTFLAERDEFKDVAKLVIAYQLIQCEINCKKSDSMYSASIPNWYQYFLGRVRERFDLLPYNEVKVLTFNYDRSFEYYLLNSLTHHYGRDEREVAEAIMAGIQIVHVHGHLGGLPGFEENGSEFGMALTVDNIIDSASRILVQHESPSINDDHVTWARMFMEQSQWAIFLGFGYEEESLKKLGFVDGWGEKYIYGTAVGYSEAECKHIQARFATSSVKLDREVDDCSDFLKKHAYLGK